MGFLSLWHEGLLSLVAPARCLRCLKEGTWLCTTCHQHIASLKYAPPCWDCGQITRSGGGLCLSCCRRTPLVAIYTTGPYSAPWIRRGVHWLKFRGAVSVAPALSSLLAQPLAAVAPLSRLQAEAVLVPIPLHRWRWRQRGFNQSELLAKSLSSITNIPVSPILKRVSATWSQAQLPPELRERNVVGAFTALKVSPRPVTILVDDVTTTGATFMAAGEALKKVGAERVWGLALGRG